MSMATLLSPIRTDLELEEFSFSNQDHHIQIIKSLRRQGHDLTQYTLDPITPEDQARWARQHAQMHLDMNAALGVNSSDLSGVDFSKPDMIASWVTTHANEHFVAAQRLGLK